MGGHTIKKIVFTVTNSGSSAGLRQFIDTTLPKFAQERLGYKIFVVHKHFRFLNPKMKVLFNEGQPQAYNIANHTPQDILKYIRRIEQRPLGLNPNQKRWSGPITSTKSVQDIWSQEQTRDFPYVFTDTRLNPDFGLDK